MRIAISLITHNDLTYLKPCLESLFNSDINQHEFKLFVCDNNSNNDLKEYLKSINVDKYIIFNIINEGIVMPRIKVYNEIIKENFDFLLELHSDMLFPKIWLEPLLNIDDIETGILQPHIYLPQSIIDVNYLEKKIESLKYDKTYNKCRQVHPWLIKLNQLNEIGGYYDENFSPQQCEDDDLVYRILKNGLKIKSTGLSWVCHYGGVTRNKVLQSFAHEHKNYFMKKNNITFDAFVKMFEYHPYSRE
jgi:GT2 family glycosyltransferase